MILMILMVNLVAQLERKRRDLHVDLVQEKMIRREEEEEIETVRDTIILEIDQ
jgi:hypothetical protein